MQKELAYVVAIGTMTRSIMSIVPGGPGLLHLKFAGTHVPAFFIERQ
jgi:hypothetical protein